MACFKQVIASVKRKLMKKNVKNYISKATTTLIQINKSTKKL